MKRKYEVMYILDQDVKDTKKVQEKLNAILSTGGKIIESAEWGLMNFAYEINHKKKGYYYVVIVETTAAAIDEFKRVTGIDKDVIRSLILNTENMQNYEQSTKLSKTDMTKFEEERRERKNNFKRPFNKPNNDFAKDTENTKKTNLDSKSTTDVKAVSKEKEVSKSKDENSHEYLQFIIVKFADHLEDNDAKYEKKMKKEKVDHDAKLKTITDDSEKKSLIEIFEKKRAEKKAKHDAEKSKFEKLTVEEREKLDGSEFISEPRSELEKHANKLRSLAPESKKHIHNADIRDMTKKELIKFMEKIVKVSEK